VTDLLARLSHDQCGRELVQHPRQPAPAAIQHVAPGGVHPGAIVNPGSCQAVDTLTVGTADGVWALPLTAEALAGNGV